MRGELREASGEWTLRYECDETAGSHREWATTTKLLGKGKNVELEITTSENNFHKGTSAPTSCQRFSISVDMLIKFIQEKGTRTT